MHGQNHIKAKEMLLRPYNIKFHVKPVKVQSVYGLKVRGSISSFHLQNFQKGSGVIYILHNRCRSSFPGVKWPKTGINHSSSYISEVQNEWSHTFPPPYTFVACTGKASYFIYFCFIKFHYIHAAVLDSFPSIDGRTDVLKK